MLFNSYIFILFFLPLTVAGYFLWNKVSEKKGSVAGIYWLLLMSLFFYGYGNYQYLVVLGLGGIINYFLAGSIYKMKRRGRDEEKKQKLLLIVGIVFQLGLLFYFKYFNFFMDTIYGLQNKTWDTLYILLPVGISFIVFSQISYLVDAYRSKEGFRDSFVVYMLWLTFFPKISSGPIVLREKLIGQFSEEKRKKVSFSNLSSGLYEFSLGLAKKVLLADTLAKLVNAGFGNMELLSGIWVWFLLLLYTLQIYFDFSGYCDMGLGIARMMNFDLTMNFNSPYKSRSVTQFWSRWHMSLTRFFTKYIYIPLGGNRKGKIRTYGNTLFVFLVSGLWHGANWTFLLWGAIHGLFMTAEKILKDITKTEKRKVSDGSGEIETKGGKKAENKLFVWIKQTAGNIYLLMFLCITWGIFRAASFGEVTAMLGKMFNSVNKLPVSVAETFQDLIEVRAMGRLGLAGIMEAYPMLPCLVAAAIMVFYVLFGKNAAQKAEMDQYSVRRSLVTAILLIWCIISLSDVSTFLYFEF